MTDRMNKAVLLGCGAAMALAAGAQAAIVNLLSTPSSGTLNGAIFETTNVRPTGTGFISPFLRIQANSIEQGYNTSARPVRFDEKTDPNFTRNLPLNSLATRTINGINYFEFMIDINEAGGGQELISLERLIFYTNPNASINPTDITQLGVVRYDMDAGDVTNAVRYNDGNSGSGQGDMNLYVPVSFSTSTRAKPCVSSGVENATTRSNAAFAPSCTVRRSGRRTQSLPVSLSEYSVR